MEIPSLSWESPDAAQTSVPLYGGTFIRVVLIGLLPNYPDPHPPAPSRRLLRPQVSVVDLGE